MFIDVKVITIYMLSRDAEPMVLTNIPEISDLKGKSKPKLVHGKITDLKKNLCTAEMSVTDNELKPETEFNIHIVF